MLLELSEDQTLLLGTLDRLAEKYERGPAHHGEYVNYNAELQATLREDGFLELARFDDYSVLDAALMVERIARLPCSVEVAASALVGSALDVTLTGPLALCEGLHRPTRYLPQATHACLLVEGNMCLAEQPLDVRPTDEVIAYPLGVLTEMPREVITLGRAQGERVRTLWQIAIAVEAAGLMRGALDLTVTYVKDRQQFSQPLGDFQAIQHRLAMAEQIVSGTRLLALRAACTLDARDAATAALYAQEQMRTVIYDCHQFHGAMGLTLEYPLHLWTYRLKFLQGELGGRAAQAEALADLLWRPDDPEQDHFNGPDKLPAIAGS